MKKANYKNLINASLFKRPLEQTPPLKIEKFNKRPGPLFKALRCYIF